MEERDELSPEFHDRLAEVYLNMTLSARKRGDEGEYFVDKLLLFSLASDSRTERYI